MASKPGVMIYFDVAPTLKLLSDKQAASLFRGILEYGQYGVVPELTGKAQAVWPMLQNRLDRDAQKYEKTVLRRQYSAYVRWERESGREPEPFESWELQHQEIQEQLA